jgi:catechol 2,3-dioxygenase-like lactoylglutathione lyase family enzyme
MSRIVHIALKCGDREGLEKAAEFYEKIFGIYTTKEKHARGHLSRHMTDGNIDLALMLYDSEDEKEAKLAGPGIQIHHIGVEVEDRPSMIKKIEENGGTIFSDRAEGALKYFAADGTLGEIVAAGRYPKKDRSKLSRISSISLRVKDVGKAVAFYKNVFGFAEAPNSARPGYRLLTDGETTLALAEGGDRPAIVSWSLEVKDPAAVAEQIKQHGGTLVSGAAVGNQTFRGPDGNTGELVKAA